MTTIDLIDTAEIARMLGVSRAHCVGRLIKRPDFPRPVVTSTTMKRVSFQMTPLVEYSRCRL